MSKWCPNCASCRLWLSRRPHHILPHSPPIVLVGAPNVGKSSQFLIIVKQSRDQSLPIHYEGIMVGEMEWQRGMDAVEQLEENGMPMRCQVMEYQVCCTDRTSGTRLSY